MLPFFYPFHPWLAHHAEGVGVVRSSRTTPTKSGRPSCLLFLHPSPLVSAPRRRRGGRAFESHHPDETQRGSEVQSSKSS